MKVLEVAPLREGLQRNITMLNRLGSEMKLIEQSIEGLVALEDSLKGEGGNAIRSFYEECHLPFLQFHSTFQKNFVSILKRMEAALDALEPNPSGVIRESFLEGEIEQGLTEIAQITESLTDEANSIMDQVADIVGLPHLDDSDVQEGVRRAKIKRDDTVTALHEFDTNQTDALTPIETDLATMDSWISNIESLFTGGTTDIDFPMERWAALSTENSLKTDLAHRTAEMGGIGGTTDAELKAFFEKIGNKTIITKDEKLIAFFEEWEKNRSSMSPNGDLIDPKTGEYIMWNQGTVRVSKDYGPRELSLIDKAGLGLANFFFLDDWKTVWNSEASIGERGFSAFSLSPQGKVVSWGVSFVKESIVGKIVKSGKVPNKSVDKVEDVGDRVEGIDKTRPSWRQSEIDVEKDFPEYNAQKSFKDGKEVPYGEKGSSRPDMYQTGHSIEVKNYKITTSSGRRNLVNNVSKQVEKRLSDLPNGTKQSVIIDIRGQNVSDEILDELYEKIMNKTNGKVDIRFKTN